MNILLISECSKNALTETRRIIDQFAERRGERTWQTTITMQGLDTLRALLRKTARKNTAVACHWIRGKDHSELMWIVGDARRFNDEGAVPTNTTKRDVLRRKDENDWHTATDIRLLSEMAALFHDVGKANDAFQMKLKQRSETIDALRHEWVSLRIFEAFVGNTKDDRDWLERLFRVTDNESFLASLKKDILSRNEPPFRSLHPPVARAVGWLILTHHHLPSGEQRLSHVVLKNILSYIDHSWNTFRKPEGEDRSNLHKTWSFSKGTPFKSGDWRSRVAKVAGKILDHHGLLDGQDRLQDPFVAHLSRLVLMLSDHYYSSLPSNEKYGDKDYPLYANTFDGKFNQRLDEHLIGVSKQVGGIARELVRLKDHLPKIDRRRSFKERTRGEKFFWQNQAYDLAEGLRGRTNRQGFFGVNMASTGHGKTRANGRIMYALGTPGKGVRFSVALGLRVLTLQTGKVYQNQFGLGDQDLAVLVGGGRAPDLLSEEAQRTSEQSADRKLIGSESVEYLKFDADTFVHYEGSLSEGPFKRWFAKNKNAQKLLSAPVLACTIDHLVPATEGTRGGRQIAPMLRLMTSDLVLDEVDDFGLEDLPAVARLVNWAGLLGTRVLLSSATLPPSLIQGLFSAYGEGRKLYRKNCGDTFEELPVCCAWFDEFGVRASDHSDPDRYLEEHQRFVSDRILHLAKQPVRRRAIIRPPVQISDRDIYGNAARSIKESIEELHEAHHVVDRRSGKRVSVGLVRMANINPMIGLAQRLFALNAPENSRLHLCCYHARYMLGVRTYIEQNLDNILNRSGSTADEDSIFKRQGMLKLLTGSKEENHIFVVLASPVAEVGRDHDYDWAIVEPSSMRSIIQLAGRVRRHREGMVFTPNLHLMAKNIRALKGESVVFHKPGFENEEFKLAEHGLEALLTKEQLDVDSRPRILEANPLEFRRRLADLEHERLKRLFKDKAPYWWKTAGHLTGFIQSQQRFRNGQPTKSYLFDPTKNDGRGFYSVGADGKLKEFSERLNWTKIEKGERVDHWCVPWDADEVMEILERIDEELGLGIDKTIRRFGLIELPVENDRDSQQWSYHPALGCYREP